MMWVGGNPFIEVYEDGERSALWWLRTSAAPADGRRDERGNTARGSTSEPNSRDETLAKPTAKEDWHADDRPGPAFYLQDNGQRK